MRSPACCLPLPTAASTWPGNNTAEDESTNVFVRKVDSQGDELWCRYYDRDNGFESIYGGCVTRSGDLVLVGSPDQGLSAGSSA